MANLNYALLDNGVLYTLGDGTLVKVQGRSARKTTVTLQRGEEIVPPETGNLGGSSFRDKLTKLAHERLGEVNGLVEDLGCIAVMFDEHLKEREEAAEDHDRETNVSEFVGTPYRISENGGFIRIKHTGGGEVSQSLTNFLAWVKEEIVRDDGAEEKRIFKIAGRIGERCLPKIDVPVSQFNSMNWVSEHWGLEAHVCAGQHMYAKEAIELYSKNAIKRYRYAHTGWRLIEGKKVYLHSAGAIT